LIPLFVRVHPKDNVAIIVAPEGADTHGEHPSGFKVNERIPQSHKVALKPIQKGERVVRYGENIGLLNRDLDAGDWVREEHLDLPAAPPLNEMPLATAVPRRLPALDGYRFEGFRNTDGSVGTRNILGITTTVQCVAPTVDYAVRRIKAEILPRFQNVDDVVAVTHGYGCGVAIDAPGAAIPISTLKYISTHANFAAKPLVVSLGCEKLQPTRLFASILPVLAHENNVVRLQDELGFGASVAAIMRGAEQRLGELNQRRRETVPASSLSVGWQ
jgi:galactarate dehydratase